MARTLLSQRPSIINVVRNSEDFCSNASMSHLNSIPVIETEALRDFLCYAFDLAWYLRCNISPPQNTTAFKTQEQIHPASSKCIHG